MDSYDDLIEQFLKSSSKLGQSGTNKNNYINTVRK